MTALCATTHQSGATYRALALLTGIAHKENVKAIVREAASHGLVIVDRSKNIAVVRMTKKMQLVTDLLMKVIPLKEVKLTFEEPEDD